MSIEKLHCPDDATWHAARSKDVTASVAAALLGAHEFETRLSLFMAKTGHADLIEESEPMRRGRLLEPVAVQIIRERHPDWTIRYNNGSDRHYYRDAKARIGATPDIEVRDPERGFGVIQIKSVEGSVYRRKWANEDREPDPPVWIAVQAMIEATLTGATWAAVAPLVVGHGIDLPEIDIPLHTGIMARLRSEVADFWRRVAANDPPDPDFGRDGALIAALYADDDGDMVDLSDNSRAIELVAAREALKSRESDGAAAAKERKTIDAELIHALGNAACGRLADGRIIEAKTIRRDGYTVEPTSYRAVKIKEGKKS